MSSASSGRYQSRLFNFVHHQSRRLRDRLKHTFGNLQVATIWSLEALLSSVYLLFQKAIESAGRQLHPEEQQPKLELPAHDADSDPETPLSSDTPIQQVLKAVEKPLIVRGIASELVSRNLVLVSDKNEILNILTRTQQEKLQDRIITEVANYWRYWRFSVEKDETKQLTEIDRLLTKLTNGVVDEMPALPEKPRVAAPMEPNPYPALALLDAAVAKLESNALVPMSRAKLAVQQRSSELIQVVQTQVNIFLYGKEHLTTSVPGAGAAENWRDSSLNIQALIWAALNFFFGDRTAKKVKQSYQKFFQQPKDAALAQRNKSTRDLTPIQKTFAKIASAKRAASSISQVESKSNKGEISEQQCHHAEVEAKPDWIETKAKTVGYEKHPLEQILEWLDSAMLLLEEIFIKMFQSLQRLWQGRGD